MDDGRSKASPTALPSSDVLGLGRTSGQRGAEIMAGVRAEITPSPITIALSPSRQKKSMPLHKITTV
jgi:hypothetical protein